MLAKTMKTAAELGIAEHEYNALVTVLYMMEDGQIPPERIYMSGYHCGTRHCIAGWANEIDKTAFPESVRGWVSGTVYLQRRLPPTLVKLFGIDPTQTMRYAEPERAVRALRTYLETGSV